MGLANLWKVSFSGHKLHKKPSTMFQQWISFAYKVPNLFMLALFECRNKISSDKLFGIKNFFNMLLKTRSLVFALRKVLNS